MRTLLTMVIAATLAMPLLPGTAAAAADHLLVDPAGDAKVSVTQGGPGVALAGDQTSSTDLLFLDLAEASDSFTFTLGVTSLQGSFTGSNYYIYFQYLNESYAGHTAYFTDPGNSGPFTYAALEHIKPNGFYETLARFEPLVDTTKGTITFTIPKVYLVDEKGHTPQRGETLSGIHVTAERSVFGGTFDPAITDAMPDDEKQGVSYAFTQGDYSTGTLFLDSPEKVRVSNGGATTFVYQARIANSATSEDEVSITLSDLPAGWNGTVQSPVKVPSHGVKTIPILATVPFAHKHGGFDSFNVTIKSQRNLDSMGRMTLGVLHTPIPQPAGHHNELYLHAFTNNQGLGAAFNAAFPFGSGWINTEKDHAKDGPYVTPTGYDNGRVFKECLDPTLSMGLDFDVLRTGTLQGNILNRAPSDAQVSAALVLTKDGDGQGAKPLVLAKSNKAKLAQDTQKAQPFTLVLTPTAESDYVGYAKGQNMCIVLTVDIANFDTGLAQPELMTDGFLMVLPLNEYSDKLDGIAEAASVISLTPIGAVEKAAKPGTLMTYAFDLKNDGLTEDTFNIEASGPDAKLGTLIPDGSVTLKPKESKTITLGVHLPNSGNDGQVYEVLVFVHAQSDPSKSALARTKTTVTHGDKASADESAQLLQAARAQERKTPGPTLPFVLVGLVAVALLARRARR